MRMTVGPLPASVYWGRRLLLLGLVGLIVLVVVYSCSGGPEPTSAPGSATTSAVPSLTPGASGSVLGSGSGSVPGSAPPSPFVLPVATDVTTAPSTPTAPPTGDCTDTELKVVATSTRQGQAWRFTITITNVGSRVCRRDIGGIMQELLLLDGETIRWSSDDVCGADEGHYWQDFVPGLQRSFYRDWAGRPSRTATGALVQPCGAIDTQPKLPSGTYYLQARLAQLLSPRVAVQVNPAS